MQRYKKRVKFYHQNLIFKNDASKFYGEIGKEKVTVNEIPAINDINEKAEWIKNVQTDYANIQDQKWSDISVKEL